MYIRYIGEGRDNPEPGGEAPPNRATTPLLLGCDRAIKSTKQNTSTMIETKTATQLKKTFVVSDASVDDGEKYTDVTRKVTPEDFNLIQEWELDTHRDDARFTMVRRMWTHTGGYLIHARIWDKSINDYLPFEEAQILWFFTLRQNPTVRQNFEIREVGDRYFKYPYHLTH